MTNIESCISSQPVAFSGQNYGLYKDCSKATHNGA